MKRWLFSIVVPLAGLSVIVGAHVSQPTGRFAIIEATIPDIQDALRRGDLTSRDLVDMYLARIEKYEPLLNAVISIHPRARSGARSSCTTPYGNGLFDVMPDGSLIVMKDEPGPPPELRVIVNWASNALRLTK